MLLNKTISVCPVCKREISADIVENNGSILMQKHCAEHGNFEVKIAKNAWYYKGLISFYNSLFSENFSEQRKCTFNVFFATSSCNLNCPICFTDANLKSDSKELDQIQIKEYLKGIKNSAKIIRLSGGEPTLRNDLAIIIRLISESGNYAYMFTNGLKLTDYTYLKSLKKSGLQGVIMWMDSLKDDQVHKLIRGRPIIKEKMRAIKNIQKLRIPFCLYHVKVKGVNDPDLKDIWEYVLKNKFVKSVWVKSYAHLGKKGFSRENEFVIDELIEEIIKINNGIFSLEDMYCYQKFNYILAALENTPFCYSTQTMILPRRAKLCVEFARYSKLIDEFEKIWKDSKCEAKKFFRYHVISQLKKYMPVSLIYFLMRQKLSNQPMYKAVHELLPSDYFFMIVNTFYDAWNYDKTLVYRQCFNGVFHLNPLRNIPLCELNVRSFS
jgi:uncharacterized radical SAM superfamily Fe-S cluster-containing enzyme